MDRPVEIHCHGIARIDFSVLDRLDLRAVDSAAAAEGILCVLTIFLPRGQLGRFVSLTQEFDVLSRAGELPHLAGLALEGPLLASSGGTPARAAWQPTTGEWALLASCGANGLRYVVLSPDFASPHSALRRRSGFTLEWAIEQLLDNGVAPALGHFARSDPKMSADHAAEILAINAARGYPVTILTDHLFNDMPLTFRHAWRGTAAQLERGRELSAALRIPWELDDLDETVGVVPATLLRAAMRDELMLCLNFDGEHVDPAYCRRTVDLVGSRPIIAMTDRTDIDRLAGEPLHKLTSSSLWYHDGDVVAAGSTPVARQITKIRALGFSDDVVHEITAVNPRRALRLGAHAVPKL